MDSSSAFDTYATRLSAQPLSRVGRADERTRTAFLLITNVLLLAKVLPLTPPSLCFRQYFSAETFLFSLLEQHETLAEDSYTFRVPSILAHLLLLPVSSVSLAYPYYAINIPERY